VMRSPEPARAVTAFNTGSFTGIVINSEHGARGLEGLDFLLDLDPDRLRHVNVLCYTVKDDSAVERLNGLTSLSLTTGSTRRLRLDEHAFLTQLGIEGDRFPKAGLAHLPLTHAYLAGPGIRDWTQLPHTLQFAKLIWRRLDNLTGLDRLSLRQLVLAYASRVPDWSAMASQTEMNLLEIGHARLGTLHWLQAMPSLEALRLENCGTVHGWDALNRSARTLRSLGLYRTTVADAPTVSATPDLARSVFDRGDATWRY